MLNSFFRILCITNPGVQEKTKTNIPLKNGDYCIIRCFEDMSNIYVAKIMKNIVNGSYELCDISLIWDTNLSNG